MTTLYSTGFVERRNQGGAFASLFANGSIEVRSGRQPASADAAPTGTLLARITRNGGVWTPGSPGNGLNFVAAGRYITKQPDEQWVMRGITDGLAGWFRLVANPVDPGEVSLTALRVDGAIALLDTIGEYEMFMSDTVISTATMLQVPHWWHGTPPLT